MDVRATVAAGKPLQIESVQLDGPKAVIVDVVWKGFDLMHEGASFRSVVVY